MRFVERKARKLSRQVFHGMVVHQGKLQNKQGYLFRLVDIACELLAIAATVSRAQSLATRRAPEAAEARRVAEVFCLGARRRVQALFHDLWRNDDVEKYRAGVAVLDGKWQFLEEGILSPHERMHGGGEAAPAASPAKRETAIAS